MYDKVNDLLTTVSFMQVLNQSRQELVSSWSRISFLLYQFEQMYIFSIHSCSCWMFIRGEEAWYFGAPVLILVLVRNSLSKIIEDPLPGFMKVKYKKRSLVKSY